MESTSSKHSGRHSRAQSTLGTLSLLFGAALVCLAFVAEMDGRLPFFMPHSWYVHRFLWYFLAMASFGFGSYLLKSRPGGGHWRAERPGIRFRQVVLYTRAGCHLCDDAKQTLHEYGDYLPTIHEVDINADRQLLQRFGTCVPVIEIDGKLRFRGGLNEVLLRRLIEGTDPLNRDA